MKKKKFFALFVAALSCAFTVLMSSCSNATKYFGEFSYYGKFLTDYAVGKSISATAAKSLVARKSGVQSSGASTYSAVTDIVGDETAPSPSDEEINNVLNTFASVEITATYYDEKGNKQTKLYTHEGTSLKSALKENEFSPSNQICAKYIFINMEILDYMESMNARCQESSDRGTIPFNDIYTYWNDKNGNLVVKTADYAEIPSSISGGIGCNFRQDIEIVYDADNKVTKWQTSLGILIAGPDGTIKQGYILELDFDWKLKN